MNIELTDRQVDYLLSAVFFKNKKKHIGMLPPELKKIIDYKNWDLSRENSDKICLYVSLSDNSFGERKYYIKLSKLVKKLMAVNPTNAVIAFSDILEHKTKYSYTQELYNSLFYVIMDQNIQLSIEVECQEVLRNFDSLVSSNKSYIKEFFKTRQLSFEFYKTLLNQLDYYHPTSNFYDFNIPYIIIRSAPNKILLYLQHEEFKMRVWNVALEKELERRFKNNGV